MEMEIEMEKEIEMLMTCPDCNIDFNYYDSANNSGKNVVLTLIFVVMKLMK